MKTMNELMKTKSEGKFTNERFSKDFYEWMIDKERDDYKRNN